MRSLTALCLLASCHYLLAHQDADGPREIINETLHSLLRVQSKPVKRLVACTRNLGFSKCLSALAVWRAERGLEGFTTNSSAGFSLREDVERFPWKEYTNVSGEYLQQKLLDSTERLLYYRPLTFRMISGYSAVLKSKGNSSVSLDVRKDDEVEGRGTMKKLQKEFIRLAPILLAPGLIISAMLPFALPSLKMMVSMVGMMNNMALVSAIFTILRNNAFDDRYNHRIVYVNNGYKNDKHNFAASTNHEHYHTNHLGILYDDAKTRIPSKAIEDQQYPNNFGNIEELPPLAVSPQWIKEYTDQKMFAMLNEKPNDNLYYDGDLSIRRSKSN